jgi:hypothetical protein
MGRYKRKRGGRKETYIVYVLLNIVTVICGLYTILFDAMKSVGYVCTCIKLFMFLKQDMKHTSIMLQKRFET